MLGIAPYEGMKVIMQKLAQERDDLNLDVFIGDLKQGPEVLRQHTEKKYDVIISRGGTAQLLRRETYLPVIEVGLSLYDILRSIKLAETYDGRYAIVSFPNIVENARQICDLLQISIDTFSISSHDEVQETLIHLRDQGYQMILCGMNAYTMAKRIGLNAVLFTSGPESISAAFDQAVKISHAQAALLNENLFYRDILHNASDHVLVLKEDGSLFYSNFETERYPNIAESLSVNIPSIMEKKTQKFFHNLDGLLYSFTCKSLSFLGERYAAFYFSSNSVPIANSKYGIQYLNLREEEDPFFDSFYSITNVDTTIRSTIDGLSQSRFPVMISGEVGLGKEQVARIIYTESELNTKPLIIVNCALLNERSWNFLTNHYNSPFNDNENTIFIKDITELSENRRKHLLSIIIDTNLCKRNRLIFSCKCPFGQGMPSEAMEFVNQLSCVTLHLPPLRDSVVNIPTLATLYLSTINASSENQIIGLDANALALLQSYNWPYNYTQFKRILNELALITKTPYIHAEQVAQLLEKEEPSSEARLPASSDETCNLDLSRPLSEITQEIIQRVLEQNNGNQTATAKQLNIGRSTLWRYLK
ncbi:MAG: PrpR N-terminal domain-containing protein [Eubacteriales bacterium]|nr:PrpR N-terminal domain-containing protein [Eubacteriales bacterium]